MILGGEMAELEQEELRVLLLNNKHAVMRREMVYRGTVNSASIRVSEILRPAIRGNCPSIIIVHNHPSGDPTPSPEDILVTRRLRQSAEMMDIDLLDHIVIGQRGFVSMKSRNLGF
jgi:DNA repair protein RadC